MIFIYCIVQKIENKKQDKYGEHKELEVYSWSINGKVKWSYRYSNERYERPTKTAYKITLRESHRVNGKVKAKIWTIGTWSYYDLIGYGVDYYDLKKKIESISEETGISSEKLIDLVYSKVDPLIEQIKAEFKQTEEYKAKQEHEAVLSKYRKDKAAFESKYGNDTYDYCYDVFGNLRNEEYLEQLKKSYSYQEKQRSNYDYSRYQKHFRSNYDNSSYQQNIGSNYTEEDKVKLKKCFKVLAAKFHPDNPSGDTEMMQFINDKLKKEWDL